MNEPAFFLDILCTRQILSPLAEAVSYPFSPSYHSLLTQLRRPYSPQEFLSSRPFSIFFLQLTTTFCCSFLCSFLLLDFCPVLVAPRACFRCPALAFRRSRPLASFLAPSFWCHRRPVCIMAEHISTAFRFVWMPTSAMSWHSLWVSAACSSRFSPAVVGNLYQYLRQIGGSGIVPFADCINPCS